MKTRPRAINKMEKSPCCSTKVLRFTCTWIRVRVFYVEAGYTMCHNGRVYADVVASNINRQRPLQKRRITHPTLTMKGAIRSKFHKLHSQNALECGIRNQGRLKLRPQYSSVANNVMNHIVRTGSLTHHLATT